MSGIYTFPLDFLKKSALDHSLSDGEAIVFELLFSKGLEKIKIAESLGIKRPALDKRMGSIYEKYGITGREKGKDHELLQIINNEFEQYRLVKASEKEIIDIEVIRENESVRYEIKRIWQELYSLRNNIDGASQTNAYSEASSRVNNIYELIDNHIENLEDLDVPALQTLENFVLLVPGIIEELSVRSSISVTDREIAISLLKCFKRFVKKSELKYCQETPIEVLPQSSEDAADS